MGAASPASIDPGQNVAQNRRKYVPGGAPWDSRPAKALANMSSPTDFIKNVSPDLLTIAKSHGSVSTTNQAQPANGRSDHSQRTERSTIDSVTAVITTKNKINGPLSRTPPASAVHRIPGMAQP